MKCEECLPLIEEYVDGELSEKDAARLESHLATCVVCAKELETLGQEQEIYARYERDLDVAPTQWNIVRARIEQAEDGLAPQHERRKGWFGWIFAPLSSFRPGLVAALVLIAVGITAGVMYLSYRPQKTDVARVEKSKDIPTANPVLEVQQPGKPDEGVDEAVANIKEPGTLERAPVAGKKNRPRNLQNNRTSLLAKKPVYRRRAPDVPIGAPDVEELALRKGEPASGDFDSDVSRHAERAQMLLRSFRNMTTEESAHATDVSYEKEQSRKLLYQNIALRRHAEGRGDDPARDLLNTLEPILLDIANLPDKARARDVRSIEQRMKKKEIVAALQVRQLLAAN